VPTSTPHNTPVPTPPYVNIVQPTTCDYWVAPLPIGDDRNPGTLAEPWATLEHAAANVLDNYCTVWFENGIYAGHNALTERFATPTTFKAINPYQVVLEHSGSVIELDGVRNMTFEGFELRHSGPGADKYIVIADRRNDIWSEYVTFRNNIFHDSYNEDILKIHNGSRFFTIENNIFYNQSEPEQHMDVNSVTDIVIQDNIFFNDFAGSGRPNTGETKHFIVVKDSNEDSDGLEGSKRITIRRNIFLNWEGSEEAFLQIGNDGKSYHEAEDVLVENNLMIGNGSDLAYGTFGVKGARNVAFVNNTVVGNLPADAYAFDVTIARDNPLNENIFFVNNIWSDPTGTMGTEQTNNPKFSNGKANKSEVLILYNNLYWNGGEEIPEGNSLTPLEDDGQPFIADPLLNEDQSDIVLPRWNGNAFLSGNHSIREEFERLVNIYGRIPANSPVIGKAQPLFAPTEDILGHFRGSTAELGAYEFDTITLDHHLNLPLVVRN
jgi:hypothetical protein